MHNLHCVQTHTCLILSRTKWHADADKTTACGQRARVHAQKCFVGREGGKSILCCVPLQLTLIDLPEQQALNICRLSPCACAHVVFQQNVFLLQALMLVCFVELHTCGQQSLLVVRKCMHAHLPGVVLHTTAQQADKATLCAWPVCAHVHAQKCVVGREGSPFCDVPLTCN